MLLDPSRRNACPYLGGVDTARLSPLEPLARAYQHAVPENPTDDGLFGPRSLVWRVNRDRCFPLAAIRSLMVQALIRWRWPAWHSTAPGARTRSAGWPRRAAT